MHRNYRPRRALWLAILILAALVLPGCSAVRATPRFLGKLVTNPAASLKPDRYRACSTLAESAGDLTATFTFAPSGHSCIEVATAVMPFHRSKQLLPKLRNLRVGDVFVMDYTMLFGLAIVDSLSVMNATKKPNTNAPVFE